MARANQLGVRLTSLLCCTIILVAAVFIECGGRSAHAAPPETDEEFSTPNATVTRARGDLASLQKHYVDSLTVEPGATLRPRVGTPAPPAEVSSYVAQLRSDLRSAVVGQLAASAEVDIAVSRAAIRTLEERIAAYEHAFGRGDGAPTNRWNVLTDGDLTDMEKTLRRRLRILLAESARFPDTELTLQTKGRLHDLRTELEAIESERIRRTHGTSTLVTVADTPTAARPERALARIADFEITKSEYRAERALAIEIAERKAWAPNDPALTKIELKINSGHYSKAILASVRGSVWNQGWPPGRGPPTRPPPSIGPGTDPSRGGGGSGAAVATVRDSVAAEVEALTRRDVRGLADAAARRSAAANWLYQMTGQPTAQMGGSFDSALASLSTTELKTHQADLMSWKVGLQKAAAAHPAPDWRMELELREVDVRLRALASEIAARGPPPPAAELGPRGPQAVQAAAAWSEAASRSPTFSEYYKIAVERQRMIELLKQFDSAAEVDRVALQEAIDVQKTRMAAISEHDSKAIAQAERAALISGRGTSGALGADHAQALRRAAQSRAISIAAEARAAAQSAPAPLAGFTAPGMAGAYEPHLHVGGQRFPVGDAPNPLRFDQRFTRDGLNSASAFRNNPTLAPGGVIVDLTLPNQLAERLSGIRYVPAEGYFVLRLSDGTARRIHPSVPPQTARAALGFVYDGRVAVVDIGAIGSEMQLWMAKEGLLPARPTVRQIERVLRLPKVISVVRYNPAVADTGIALELVAADELIFDVISLDPVFLASRSVFRGLDTREAHRRLNEDLRGITADNGFKSILTVDSVEMTETADEIRLKPNFDYAVYALPRKLELVSAWFAGQDERLRSRSPELRALENFAVAVAILRTAETRGFLGGAAPLRLVVEPGDPTPALLCRSEAPGECDDQFFRDLVDVTSDF